MGMTIEEARTALGKERKYALHENKQAFDIAIDTMRKYQQLQADYENRLKADLVAMLTDIQLEIEELNHKGSNCYRDEYTPYSEGLDDCKDIIQQIINSLKEA